LIAVAILQHAVLACAADECTPVVARIVSIEGSVEVRASRGANSRPAQLDVSLCPGYVVEVGRHSRAALRLVNETTLRLDQLTALTVIGPDRASNAYVLDLWNGATHVITRAPQRAFKIRTYRNDKPFINASVEGTEFLVRVGAEGADFVVFDGALSAATETAVLGRLDAGSQAHVDPGEETSEKFAQRGFVKQIVRPRDGVQWALYYPVAIGSDAVSNTLAESRLLISASQMLAVGRVDQANRYLAQVLASNPRNADALSLQAIIAVVLDEKDEALRRANEAVESNRTSPTARIARSYAWQARFDIDKALDDAKAAAEVDAQNPRNAFAWARLAELYLAKGDLPHALRAGDQAVGLDAKLAKTQTVLGFAKLTVSDTKAAREAFERAVSLDQADPLPRLGLGLARIREGDLQAGREQIEIAAVLDPGNSLVRSYLGRAYFSEHRDDLAKTEFELAKQRDPNDPTPWFYDAIRKQSANRPSEAIEDFETSIRLNDNKAVYRSRLLLDDDRAARTATLARSYTDVGLSEVAVAEAAKALVSDPGNAAAHRFLSDTYALLPRHEIARASELLQAQLREPINGTPLQAQLANDQLFTLRTADPIRPGLDDLGSAFTASGVGAEFYGTAGTQRTWGVQPVVYAKTDRFAFGASAVEFRTDGVRANNDLSVSEQTYLAQAAVGPYTTLNLEYTWSDRRSGDRISRFDPEAFSEITRMKERHKDFRFAMRQVVSGASDLLFVVTRQERTSVGDFGDDFVITVDNDTTKYELQYLYRQGYLSARAGAAYVTGDTTENVFGDVLQTKPRHTNAYLYSTIAPARNLPSVELGFSYDRLSSSDAGTQVQFNPKIGAIWSPSEAFTLRAAAFRVLKRRLNTNEGLEPTQVAGFNQFFDDLNAAKSWGTGIAADGRLLYGVRYGAEVVGRNVRVPLADLEQNADFFQWKERQASVYLHKSLSSQLSIIGRVRYSKYERPEQDFGDEAFTAVDTVEVPLSLRYFDRSGIWSYLNVTYVRQHGRFLSATSELLDGNDRFGVVDAAIGYRLPRRLGAVSLQCTNLLDRSFRFQDVGLEQPRYVSARQCSLQLSLSV
jgi:tetratricopeptide (TPR) repeat protein